MLLIIFFTVNIFCINVLYGTKETEKQIFVHGTFFPLLPPKCWYKSVEHIERVLWGEKVILSPRVSHLCNGLKVVDYVDENKYNFYHIAKYLSEECRKISGKKLYESIKDLKKVDSKVKITLLCHSHGNNVLSEAVKYAV